MSVLRIHVWLVALLGCASTQKGAPTTSTPADGTTISIEKGAVPREPPPAAGPRKDVRFPSIVRTQLANGLELNVVELHQLPVVNVRLIVRSGSATDPAELPGLAQLTAAMLKEGTTQKSSAKLAEAVDFLGAHLGTGSDEDTLQVSMQALSEHLEQALEIVGEVATKPAFSEDELKKLKTRELARLELQSQSPHFLAQRELTKVLYGEHPYNHVDTTKAAIKRVKRTDLAQWHKRYVTPGNAFLVVVGDVSAARVQELVARVLGGFAPRTVPELAAKTPPARSARNVVLVDRPKSVQSVIYFANLALPRNDPDYIPLTVANQVLGGSAAARLFMDLREKRSLTYGAYSDIDEHQQVGPFLAYASVRNEVTADALRAFDEHLQRIVREPPSVEELTAAKRYLIDRFPLRIETPDRIAGLVAELRTFGLPDDYWSTFEAKVDAVTPAAALAVAQKHVRPAESLLVVVGEAAQVRSALDPYGGVTVVDTEGKLVVAPASAAAPAPSPTPSTSPTPAKKGP
jgi:zinc protease